MKDFKKDYLGDKKLSLNVANRAKKNIVGYQLLLKKHNMDCIQNFNDLPITDKKNYMVSNNYTDILAENYDNCFSIFRSSGSSGKSFYWPQLRENHLYSTQILQKYLEEVFVINEKKTLAIVGLALGSWVGGEHFSWILKSMAINLPYPFTVFSPGSNHEEIIEIITKANKYIEQFIIFACPSAISHLHLKAEEKHEDLPFSKIRYITLGEPFPETIRNYLREKSSLTPNENVLFSIYGSADTGTLGVETPATVAIRNLLSKSAKLRESLNISLPLPHFFHFISKDTYVETIENELCITKWQGIPLMRYNLHDGAELLDWKLFKQAILSSLVLDTENELIQIIKNSNDNLPDILAIFGRSDSSLILCGTNITEFMLDEAVRCQDLTDTISGNYEASIVYENNRQHLRFNIELKKDVVNNKIVEDKIYMKLIKSLGIVQPEFLDDWKNVYSVWDEDPKKRILKINLLDWPYLSEKIQNDIKHRGIIKSFE
ncbi:MAG: hypothetical protein GY936_13295 [Ignavibacteriae bacterium]|nr:hypothetical protein [Ignavibacteriota bacterium]